MTESNLSPAKAGQDQPAVSWVSNNTGSRSAPIPDPRVIQSTGARHAPLSSRPASDSPSPPAGDDSSSKLEGQIWIGWVCAIGMILTLLARCVFGG